MMSSCTCPACSKYPPYQIENFGWGFASLKTVQLKDNEKREEQTQSEQLSPSPYKFLSASCFPNAKQSWGNDSLFTFNKYTANVSTGISSTSMPKRSSSPAPSSDGNSGNKNVSIEGNKNYH